MTSKRVELLQRERDSFRAHEKRILRERDEILVNIRNHISALENEILRLGGDINKSEYTHLSSPSIDNVVPSIAPFPPVKKPRGRPTMVGENSSKKKRGRPRKSETKIVEVENEITPSKPPKNRHEQPLKPRSGEIGRPNDAMSPLTSIATSLINLKTDLRFLDVASNATNIKIAMGQDWRCDCGELIAHTKTRCGKCRRWKGGKREKKWTLKGRKAKPRIEKAKLIYNMLSNTTLDAGSSLHSEDCNAHSDGADEINIRTEVETIVRNVALAVSRANGKQTNDKKRDSTEQKATEQEVANTDAKRQHLRMQRTEEGARVGDKLVHAPFAFESLCMVAKMHMNSEAPQDEVHHHHSKS
ncbi:hypothetical protein HJC23_013075 [Cyclotella cryptica]|uniref:RanBP2-type domain-containing protein n=1 Tax=Cyclotella cryptica TaxID=29204 RepID=A0ABD3Q795_9STRA